MDLSKLEGITSAIEAEWKQPYPSHSNLARLTALGFQEIGQLLNKQQIAAAVVTTSTQGAEVKLENPGQELRGKRVRRPASMALEDAKDTDVR